MCRTLKSKRFVASAALGLALACAQPGAAQTPGSPEAANSQEAFTRWLAADPTRQTAFGRFEAMLAEHGVAGVVPTFQLWRSASAAARCQREDFVSPEPEVWANIVPTLRFIRDHIEPAVGEVEVMSGYRDAALNACAGGRPRSAHRQYVALDLVPLDPGLARAALIERLCRVHRVHGSSRQVGLGFYSGVRFHIDTMRYRRWGADGTSQTSPCVQYDR